MRTIVLFIFLFQFCTAFSQSETITVDLAEFDGKSTTLEKPLQSNKIRTILLINRFAKIPYDVLIDIEVQMMPALTLSGSGDVSPCQVLMPFYKAALELATTTDKTANEKSLKNAIEKLQEEQKKNPCTDLDNDIKSLFQSTKHAFAVNLDLQPREDLVITVKRGDKIYKIIYKGKQESRWVINYGFAFTSRALEPKRYFTEEVGVDSFKISQKEKHDIVDLRFTPTIFFSYFLNKNLSKSFNHSITGGLGFNTQSPVVLLGYSAIWNQNVGVSLGLSFYEQQKLLGRYMAGQVLKESLEEDQLYEKAIFRPNFFLAVNFRLSENPFKSSTSSNNETGNK